jgi:hypothetical protein
MISVGIYAQFSVEAAERAQRDGSISPGSDGGKVPLTCITAM